MAGGGTAALRNDVRATPVQNQNIFLIYFTLFCQRGLNGNDSEGDVSYGNAKQLSTLIYYIYFTLFLPLFYLTFTSWARGAITYTCIISDWMKGKILKFFQRLDFT